MGIDKGTFEFGVLLGALADGEFREEVNSELRMLTERLHERSVAGARTVKGTLTITIDVSVASNGMVSIAPNVTDKLPRSVRKDTAFWLGERGLTQDNPKQQKLALREAGEDKAIKEG